MYVGVYIKFLLFLYCFNETWIWSTDVNIIQIQNFRKFVQWESSFQYGLTDGQTYMTDLVVGFRICFVNKLDTCYNKFCDDDDNNDDDSVFAHLVLNLTLNLEGKDWLTVKTMALCNVGNCLGGDAA
jgi:hypothetical protein